MSTQSKQTIIPHAASPAVTPEESQGFGWGGRTAKKLLLGRLQELAHGEIHLHDGDERHRFGQVDTSDPLHATVTVRDRRFYKKAAFGGTLGVADAFIQGWWTCDNLTDLTRVFVRNMGVADGMERGPARLLVPFQKAWHWMRRNTRVGSQRNIEAHYDLGNDLYQLFLDETMAYSCGVFETPESSLYDASIAKFDRICRKLDLRPTDHLVEIGTGWGGFAVYAARQFGCRITTTTISKAQHEIAKQRIDAAGLSDRIELLLEDYRDLTGSYDKLVSIEMVEAVGDQFLETYFAKCSQLLKDDGMMCIQAITMPDQRYDQYVRSVDFIRRYIFPGSCVPSLSVMNRAVARSTNLRMVHLEDIGIHYATTLRLWREQFFDRIEDVRALGYPDGFIRMWDYYLSHCEASFAERYCSDVHMVLAKPKADCDSLLNYQSGRSSA